MNAKCSRVLLMYLTGGIIYFYFEILVRGYSHISMFLLGGLCFCLVGTIGNLVLMKKLKFLKKLILITSISGCIITFLELLTGLLVNIYFDLHVWDYSNMKMNYMGQICMLYSVLWALLGLPCVYFYGLINRFIFEE